MNKIFNTLILLIILGYAPNAEAARLFFDQDQVVADVNTKAEAILMIDTEGEDINALEVLIDIPKGIKVESIAHGTSIVTLWVNKPVYENNQINFSGIIPGGYRGVVSPSRGGTYVSGEVLRFVFSSDNTEEKTFKISKADILMNDGKGTEANVSSSNLKYVYAEGVKPDADIKDNIPPDRFFVSVTSDEIFDSPYTLVFNTRDGQSGIAYYEIKIGDEDWKIIESPYGISSREFKEIIQIKAVDYFGNVRIEPVITDASGEQKEGFEWNVILLILSIILAIVYFIYIVRKRDRAY